METEMMYQAGMRVGIDTLFENAQVGMFFCNPMGTLVKANKSGLDILGIGEENYAGKDIREIFAGGAGDSDRIRQEIDFILQERMHSLQMKIMTPKGEKRFVESCSVPVKEDGATTGFVLLVRDVTVSKEEEYKLLMNRRYLHEIFQNMAAGMVIIDVETHTIIDINKEAERMIGTFRSEVIGQVCHQFICPAERGKCPISDLGQTIDRSERTLLTAQVKQVPIMKTAVYAIVNDRPCLIESFIDITARKEAELALQKERDFARQLVEMAPVVVIVCDKIGTVTSVNPYMEKITGYLGHDLTGRKIESIISDDDGNACQFKRLHELASAGSLQDIICTITTRQGEKRVIAWYFTLMKDSAGAETGLLCVGHDVTQQRQAEHQLHQSEKLHAIGMLAGGIAHDFNNQLACVRGYAEMLRDKTQDNQLLARFVDNILIAVQHASDLTTQLLSFARKGKHLSVPVNMHKSIQEVISLLEHSIDKRIQIKKELSADNPVIIGDPTQIQNSLLNLALNARDAMPLGGILSFRTSTVLLNKRQCAGALCDIDPGRYLSVEVADTGVGMEVGVMDHIFEPFFTTKGEGKGVGMGLAAVYGAVKSHKGGITVKSTPDVGTSFMIFLPVGDLLQEKQTEQEHQSLYAKKVAFILVIDDEPMVCGMVSEMLGDLGYTAHAICSGKEAINYFWKEHRSIDCVILDFVMPEINGAEIYTALNEIDPGICVLLATGYALSEQDYSQLKGHNLSYIKKPFEKWRLSQMVSEALEKRKKR